MVGRKGQDFGQWRHRHGGAAGKGPLKRIMPQTTSIRENLLGYCAPGSTSRWGSPVDKSPDMWRQVADPHAPGSSWYQPSQQQVAARSTW